MNLILNNVKSGLFKGIAAISLGAAIMVGMRIIEYTIPKPDVKVLICYENSDTIENCEYLSDILAKAV